MLSLCAIPHLKVSQTYSQVDILHSSYSNHSLNEVYVAYLNQVSVGVA